MMKDNSQARVRREADKLFKQVEAKKTVETVTDYERAQQSFHQNRERLKAERLAREAKR
jgi:hypothetical protein